MRVLRLAPQRDLRAPRRRARLRGDFYDPEAFGRFSETIARYLGTARYLVFQTVVVTVWILWNAFFRDSLLAYDPYPFILLTLALSLQASYAAPLILLAQNRQEERDRTEMEIDRGTNARTLADTEYLARELAAIRMHLGELVTRDYFDEHIQRLEKELDLLRAEAGRPEADSRRAPTDS
jgi:uncharacterized membrane protein